MTLTCINFGEHVLSTYLDSHSIIDSSKILISETLLISPFKEQHHNSIPIEE